MDLPPDDIRIEESADERSLVLPTLRLRFRWNGDRWVHSLEIGPEESRTALARSFEETPDRGDPGRVISPTYQEIQLRSDSGVSQALLVGMSGPHHFSAVVHARRVLHENQVTDSIEFEVADRCRIGVDALASTYLIEPVVGRQVNHGDESPHANVVWEALDEGVDFLGLSTPGPTFTARIHLAPARPPAFLMAQAEAQRVAGSSTLTYRYRWSVLSSPGSARPATPTRPWDRVPVK